MFPFLNKRDFEIITPANSGSSDLIRSEIATEETKTSPLPLFPQTPLHRTFLLLNIKQISFKTININTRRIAPAIAPFWKEELKTISQLLEMLQKKA